MKMIALLFLTCVTVSTAGTHPKTIPYNDPPILHSFELEAGASSDGFEKLLDGDENCWYLRFKVKSDSTVFVEFYPSDEESENYIVVMIGALYNFNTCIVKYPGNIWISDVFTPGIVDGTWQYFYIRRSHSYWEIGYEYTGKVIAYGNELDDLLHIRYFRVRSENKSSWKMFRPGLSRRIVKQDVHHPGKYVWDFPKFYSNNFYLEFAVKSGENTSVVLSPTNTYGENFYEIRIDVGRTRLCFGVNKDGVHTWPKDIELGGLLDGNNYRYFWVRIEDGELTFGRYGEESPLFEYKDDDPLDIRYFGITSYPVKSWWKFYLPCPEPLLVCEWETLDLKCPSGRIIIEDALYGRENRGYCYRDKPVKVTSGCGDPRKSFQVLRERCHKKQECSIEATNDVFGDPCYGTFKYLQVEYSCCDCY